MKSTRKAIDYAWKALNFARKYSPFSDNKGISLAKAQYRLKRDQLAFLPAALEIVETPPSPVGRTIAFVNVAFFCLALLWASFGRVDIVASASGKVIPTGRTKVVQPFETGVVHSIRVHDGESVHAGDVLIELDSTLNQADQGHIRSDLLAAQLEVARLQAAMSDSTDPVSDFHPPVGSSPSLVATQRQLLINQLNEQRAKIASLDQHVAQREAERATIVATLDKLKATIPVLEERVGIRQVLFSHQTGSKANYLEILQSLLDSKHELEVQQSRYNEANAAIAAAKETREQTAAEYKRTMLNDLAEAERKAAGFSHDLEKANEKAKLQVLTAPVDGVVQQLAVHTIGGVVTPAQALLLVVPSDSHLEIEAMVSNRDIGFVHPGQPAEIKVDTFNFTRYGLLRGEVLSVSSDAIVRDKPQGSGSNNSNGTLGAEDSSSEPRGQELNYAARISLDRTRMQVDERLVNLTPGMAVTVEIKTGSRRVISYLLSPVLRYGHDSIHER